MIGPIFNGALGALGGSPVSKVTEEGMDKLPHHKEGYQQFLEDFPQEWQKLREDIKAMVKTSKQQAEPRFMPVTLFPGGEWTVNKGGYSYVVLMVPNTPTLSITVLASRGGSRTIGPLTTSVWYTAIVNDGDKLSISGTSPRNLVMLYSDKVISSSNLI